MRKRRRTPQQQATGIGSQGTGSINEKEINLYDAKARADQAKLNPKQAPVCHFHSCAISLAASGQSVKREAKVEQKKEGKKISLLFASMMLFWKNCVFVLLLSSFYGSISLFFLLANSIHQPRSDCTTIPFYSLF